MTYGTKSAIKAAYLQGLKDTYEWAKDGHPDCKPGLDRADFAASRVLAGELKLEGEVWFAALAANGIQKTATRAMLAALPA